MKKDTITINLIAPTDTLEIYEFEERNIVQVRVQDADGKMIVSSDYKVEISFSKDAMIGFATELLRKAYNISNEGIWHLRPVDKSLISQNLGVYLHPQSCEMLIVKREFDPIGTLLNE
jgi:hypothetical protein